jgi:hypothetical protein
VLDRVHDRPVDILIVQPAGVCIASRPRRLACLTVSRRARPVTSSLTPSEYISAVSKKLIPPSSARRKKGRADSSSSTQGRHDGVP